jgi:hypothetical protein
MVPKSLWFKCPEWIEFSPAARDVYHMLKAKYNGKNNGEIKLHYSELLKIKGLKSKHTICAAFKELESKGWIKTEKPGGLLRHPNCYTLTWKHDLDPMA